MRLWPSSRITRWTSSGGAPRRSATTRLRGTMTSATVTSPKPSARDAISLARGSTEPVFAASSTSCCSSSRDSRASVNVVRSPKNRRTRFETAVSEPHERPHHLRRARAAAARRRTSSDRGSAARATSARARRSRARGTRQRDRRSRTTAPCPSADAERAVRRLEAVLDPRAAERRGGRCRASSSRSARSRGTARAGRAALLTASARRSLRRMNSRRRVLRTREHGDLRAGEQAVRHEQPHHDQQLGAHRAAARGAYADMLRDVDAGSTAAGPAHRVHHARRREEAARRARPAVDASSGRASRRRSPTRRRRAIARENAEYIYGKRRLREIDRRVRFLTQAPRRAHVVTEPPSDPTRVFFGAWVDVEDEDGDDVDVPHRRRRRVRRRPRLDQHRLAGRARRCSASATATTSPCAGPKGDITYTIVGDPVHR